MTCVINHISCPSLKLKYPSCGHACSFVLEDTLSSCYLAQQRSERFPCCSTSGENLETPSCVETFKICEQIEEVEGCVSMYDLLRQERHQHPLYHHYVPLRLLCYGCATVLREVLLLHRQVKG